MEARFISARVGDGTLTALIGGAERGMPLLFHFGSPSAPVFWPSLDLAARQRGLRLICYARPGYPGSTPLLGRTVFDCASDSAALLEVLGAERYVTLGWSGGGPAALACARGHPGQCLAAGTVSGLMPYDSEEPAYIEGMTEEDLDWLAMMLDGAESLRPALEAEAGPLRTISAEDVAASFEGEIGPADLVALRGEISDVLARSWNLGCVTVDGWLDDLIASVNRWGFELSEIAVPISIWHGDQDRIVPPSHARWLAAHIPGADLHLLEGEGHISPVATPLPTILDDLLAKADL